jgi:DNA/RNA endonuclease G (NUC1)
VFASVPCPVCHWASEINGSWIPTACFSVVLRQTNGRWDALAVIMPNEKVVAGPVSRFLTTISSIQRATTLDILAGMDEATKTRIERERAAVLWSR